MKNLPRFAALLAAIALISCASKPLAPSSATASASGDQKPPAVVPWPSADPEKEGLDGNRLQQMVEQMRGSGREFHSVIIVRGGALVLEQYFPGWSREATQNVYSCTKSVLSALCGIAQAEGRLPGVDARPIDTLAATGPTPADPRAFWITLEQLLSMKSGLPFMRAVDMAAAEDQVAFALARPLAFNPGTRFLYTSAGPHLVSAVLQKGVGMSARDYARVKLFEPLGIKDWSWETDGTGVTIGSTNLSLSAIDLARIGFLYLHRGEWFGTQIVPSSWVKESTTAHAHVLDMNRAESAGYGYFWWIDEQWGGFSAHGAAGQFVFVVPSLDLVVVFTSGLSPDDFPIPWDLMRAYVLPAAGVPLPS